MLQRARRAAADRRNRNPSAAPRNPRRAPLVGRGEQLSQTLRRKHRFEKKTGVTEPEQPSLCRRPPRIAELTWNLCPPPPCGLVARVAALRRRRSFSGIHKQDVCHRQL